MGGRGRCSTSTWNKTSTGIKRNDKTTAVDYICSVELFSPPKTLENIAFHNFPELRLHFQ